MTSINKEIIPPAAGPAKAMSNKTLRFGNKDSKRVIDDYLKKFADYEEMGIPEYWIADYPALGGKLFIGNPKQPTLSIYELIEGEYQRVTQFRGDDRIISPTFPELNLTVRQIFQARA
ncbi:hypothetical protein NUACC21_30520 [Scytonema sp. NUACC21]